MDFKTSRPRRTYTDAQRQHMREYMRAYRAAHPEKTRAWRDAYILRRAAKLQAQAEGGADDGRD